MPTGLKLVPQPSGQDMPLDESSMDGNFDLGKYPIHLFISKMGVQYNNQESYISKPGRDYIENS